MGVQVPDEALGTAVAVLIYSTVCLLSSVAVIWLVFVHREWSSYVALLAYFTIGSTIASIIQQIHYLVAWEDLKIEQFKVLHSQGHNVVAALNAPGGVFGLDYVLYCIQYYCYSAEALLAVFWAVTLAYSVYGIRQTAVMARIPISKIAKSIGVLFPVLVILLMRAETVGNNLTAFMVLANMQMVLSMVVGGSLLIAILVKYVFTRRKLLSWNVTYGEASGTYGSGTRLSMVPRPEVPSSRRTNKTIYDRWLLVRFSLAFVLLAAFEVFTILFELRTIYTADTEQQKKSPVLTAGQANSDFVTFIPGVTASLLVFVVFGTTEPFRDHMCRTFLPRHFWRKSTYDVEACSNARFSSQSKLSASLSTHTSRTSRTRRTSRTHSGPPAGAVVVTVANTVTIETVELADGASPHASLRETSCVRSDESHATRLQELAQAHVRWHRAGYESPVLGEEGERHVVVPGKAL